jgi:Tol biopolymer transport system component
MDYPSFREALSDRPSEDRLDSWKAIAAYLGRDVTTVQRWEKREAMPVHRHLHDRIGSVYASRAELDAWVRSRNRRPAEESVNNASSPDRPLARRPVAVLRFLLPFAAACAVLTVAVVLWLAHTEYFWRTPIADGRFQTLTEFDGVEPGAAVSPDGRFVAFLCDKDGPMDVWVTQIGSGQFHNLTRGRVAQLVNASVRTLGFSPDGAYVTFWVRKRAGSAPGDIGIWAMPALGGEPRPYLEGVAEFDWSDDGARLAYHTAAPGDPLFVARDTERAHDRRIFTATAGFHSHFPLWSPDADYIYFVHGSLPDKLDIWRISAIGGDPERITRHDSRVSYPLFLDRNTLMYLAADPNGSGASLYSLDVRHRIPHRLSLGPDRYASLDASADRRRLVATRASPRRTLWRMSDSAAGNATAAPIPLTTGTGFSPRLGPDYLLYVSAAGAGESIWKLCNGASTELWTGPASQILGAPAVSRDGQYIAFSAREHSHTRLYMMQADGANARVVTDSLALEGAPAWAPDGSSMAVAAQDAGTPHIFGVPLNGRPPTVLVHQYSVDPVFAPDGRLILYSGPDVGTTFSLKAFAAGVGAGRLRTPLTLTRGARHVFFLPDGRSLVFLRGDIEHKNLWVVDLQTGVERQLTHLSPDFNIRDFDISPDGREIVLERSQERSEIVLIDVARR